MKINETILHTHSIVARGMWLQYLNGTMGHAITRIQHDVCALITSKSVVNASKMNGWKDQNQFKKEKC
jgi:hypothetical protein